MATVDEYPHPFLITLSRLPVSSVFGLMMPASGCDPWLDLYGSDLKEIKETFKQKRETLNDR